VIGKQKIKMEVPYFQVPNNCFEVNLNTYDLLVYIYLCRCGNHGGKAFPSYQTIADKTGMSKRKAMESVSNLMQNNYINKKPRNTTKGKQSNLYFVNDLVHTVHQGSASPAPYKEQENKNQQKYNKKKEIPQIGLYQQGRSFYYNGKKIGQSEYQAHCILQLHDVGAI
jgi:DNA replication protein DnaD